ncbi:hypothetical protein GCM10007860_22840 [Chitiniphilus shinanonensis]|uniref:DUF4349 domain-containing protein n=1 Tax=Chitiniphilus shinanonensis TaxID=553088 RepID=A0ABQ6BUH7_9NEIS|nr:DUF4349 domain-containing protein [Chitiniphilus shinanonensis]GLS05134.1 hypothetical protein GCM10007860_22840 [Chitiniphilus shinanonensis]
MTRVLLPLLLAAALVACGKKEEAPVAYGGNAVVSAAAEATDAAGAAPQAAPKRHIAVRHALTVETAPDRLDAAWQAAQARCVEPTCELLSANLQRDSDYSPGVAQLSLRIAPGAVTGYLAALGQQGRVVSQSTEREDKTDEVIDTEARLKNLAQLRDNLRQMLDSHNAKLEELLAVQKELAATQAQLDAAAGQRLALANQTEKVRIDVELRAARSVAERSVLMPLADAWHDIGHNFMQSVAALLTFAAVALPWLLVLWLPLRWVLKRRRLRRQRRAGSDAP